MEWAKPIPVPEALGIKTAKVGKDKKSERLRILKRIAEEEQMFASEIRNKALEQLKGHQLNNETEIIEISSDEASITEIECEQKATTQEKEIIKPQTNRRILTPEERRGSCGHGYYEDPCRVQPQWECTECCQDASQDDLSEWPRCNAAIADLKGQVQKEVKSIMRTNEMWKPHIERYHWNRYRTWLSCVKNFITGRGKWLNHWQQRADNGIQDPFDPVKTERKLEREIDVMNEEVQLWEEARIELFWDFRINHMYKGQGRTVIFPTGLGTPVYESVVVFCKALKDDNWQIFDKYWRKFETEIPIFDAKEMRELQVTRKRRLPGLMEKKKVTFAPDPDGVDYPERGGDTWYMYETIPSDDWVTEELMANCVFVGPKRPKGYETVRQDEVDKETMKEAEKEETAKETAEGGSKETEESPKSAFDIAQMLTDRGEMWKKFKEEVERISNEQQNPVTEAKNGERSLDNGEECPPVESTEKPLMSLKKIDDLERSKQAEERSNSDQSERSSTRIREEEFDEIPNFEDYKKEFDTKEPAIEIDEWVETMKKNLTFAEEVARCNIKDAYEKNAEIYNKKKSEPNFKVGDLVLIRLPKDTKQGKKENQSDFKSKYDKFIPPEERHNPRVLIQMMKHVVSKVAVEENAWIRIKVGTNDDHLAYTYTVDGKLLTKERIRPKPTADPDPSKRTLDDYEPILKYTDGTCRKVTLTIHYGDGTTECITAVIVDPITGDPIPYAPWDVSEESAEHANREALEQLWNLIPVSQRQDPLVQANTLISMMRHRAEIDEAHFRLTRKMENGAYKTVFYDAKKNPLWEIVTQGQTKETPHLEGQALDPAQEGGAGEMAEASVAEKAGTESTRRPSELEESEEEEANDDSAEEQADEDDDRGEEHEEDKQPPKVVVKPRKAAKLEEAMNREKVKKGEFLKKRKEEEDKKKKSGDESESTSARKKKGERKKKDEPSSHDVEILDESVGEAEERSSVPIIPKKFVIESAHQSQRSPSLSRQHPKERS
ncbi:uncharacterized protein LOC129589584 [Paramacrobiotus metropolitanus]|uniref:uncharacterized protein LOC129589584 n=1 Tax=Paramacrobiotus metropolitanus TaxID=2943436 RepID=UPI0024465C5B|nr:uncharacterized protein LOC129589584 [Paramacrobiotus metropolitanus]